MTAGATETSEPAPATNDEGTGVGGNKGGCIHMGGAPRQRRKGGRKAGGTSTQYSDLVGGEEDDANSGLGGVSIPMRTSRARGSFHSVV